MEQVTGAKCITVGFPTRAVAASNAAIPWGHRLSTLWDAISPAWDRTVASSRQAQEDRARFGIAGRIRLVEVKHGENGWHPHIHFLLFTRDELAPDQIEDLSRRMFGRWERALAKPRPGAREGFSVLYRHGIDLRPVTREDSTLGDYFAKSTYRSTPGAAAYEVTSSQSKRQGKGGRSPFEVLADLVRHGEERDLAIWHEWERGSSGRRQLTWSHGFRAQLAALGAALEDDKTDEQIAEEADLGGDTLAVIPPDEWKAHRWAYRRCELLEAAENGSIYTLLAGTRLADSPAWSQDRRRERQRL